MADALAISRSIMTCRYWRLYSLQHSFNWQHGYSNTLPSLQRAMYGTAVGLVPSLTPADGCGGQLLGHSRLSWCLLEGV